MFEYYILVNWILYLKIGFKKSIYSKLIHICLNIFHVQIRKQKIIQILHEGNGEKFFKLVPGLLNWYNDLTEFVSWKSTQKTLTRSSEIIAAIAPPAS